MRIVSLNLDHGDAAVVRRAIGIALDGCECADHPDRSLCGDCKALTATLVELNRLVGRPAPEPAPLLTIVAADGRLRVAHPPPSATKLEEGETTARMLAGDGGARGGR